MKILAHMTLTCMPKGLRKEMYDKLLTFIDSNNRFAVDRLYGQLSSTGTGHQQLPR